MTQIPPSPENPPAELARPLSNGATLLGVGVFLLVLTMCGPAEYAAWWSCLTLPAALGFWGWGSFLIWRELIRRNLND